MNKLIELIFDQMEDMAAEENRMLGERNLMKMQLMELREEFARLERIEAVYLMPVASPQFDLGKEVKSLGSGFVC